MAMAVPAQTSTTQKTGSSSWKLWKIRGRRRWVGGWVGGERACPSVCADHVTYPPSTAAMPTTAQEHTAVATCVGRSSEWYTARMLALARRAAVIHPKLSEKGKTMHQYSVREGLRRVFCRPRTRARRERKMPTMKTMERGIFSLAKERDQLFWWVVGGWLGEMAVGWMGKGGEVGLGEWVDG